MTTAVADVTIESSVLPPVHVSTGEAPAEGGPAEGEGGGLDVGGRLRALVLGLVRPKVTLDSVFFSAPRVVAKNGEPFPWPLGLALLLVVLVVPLGLVGVALLSWWRRKR